jgi:uncharacterized membrane protein YGL010W
MKSAEEWFDEYAESHQNPVNKAIHWVCIPLIMLSTLGLLASIPHPFSPVFESRLAHWGTVVVLLAVLFYLRLSLTLAAGMALISIFMLVVNGAMAASGISLLWVSVAIFFAAWVVQLVGHKIEGKKPSFFKDLQFLLIGPAWLLHFVFAAVGIPLHFRARPRAFGA